MDGDRPANHSNLILWGYRYSVYTRIVKMVLLHQDLAYTSREVDPFAEPPDPELLSLSPIGRVPVLDHSGFVLSETTAICQYLNALQPVNPLVPQDPQAVARMMQAISIIDAHGYWPMVRQVFSHAGFRPLIDAPSDQGLIEQGIRQSGPVLLALNTIATQGVGLNGRTLTLADLHLAPMIGYFDMATQGKRALRTYPALARWWDEMQQNRAYIETDPGLATLAPEA